MNFARNNILALCLLVLGACSPRHDGNFSFQCPTGSSRVTGEDPVPLFRASVHPILVQNCQSCHSRSTPVGPHVAGDPNADVSYGEARPRLLSSMLWVRGTDGHCQGCSVAANATAKTQFREALDAWHELETAPVHCEGGPTTTGTGTGTGTTGGTNPIPTVFTTDVEVPAALTLTNFQRVRFTLDAAGFTGAILDVGVRQLNDTHYEFGDFRLYPNKGPIEVGGLQVRVTNGGAETTSNTLVHTTYLAATSTAVVNTATVPLAVTPLTGQSMVVAKIAAGDRMKVSFVSLVAATPRCSATTSFSTNVLPLVTAGIAGTNACIGCHGQAGNAANTRWAMSTANIDTLCYTFRQRMGTTDATSLVIRKLRGQVAGHPFTVPTEQLTPLRAWRDREFQ